MANLGLVDSQKPAEWHDPPEIWTRDATVGAAVFNYRTIFSAALSWRRSRAHLPGPGDLEQEVRRRSRDLKQDVMSYLAINPLVQFHRGSVRHQIMEFGLKQVQISGAFRPISLRPVCGRGFCRRGTFNPWKRDKVAFGHSQLILVIQKLHGPLPCHVHPLRKRPWDATANAWYPIAFTYWLNTVCVLCV